MVMGLMMVVIMVVVVVSMVIVVVMVTDGGNVSRYHYVVLTSVSPRPESDDKLPFVIGQMYYH